VADPGPSSKGEVALVFAGGEPRILPVDRELLEGSPMVIAADSGLQHALALELHVDLVVGDLDSAEPGAVAAAVAAGAEVLRYPTAKDATDLELALVAARAHGARRLVVVGGGGGRLDHLLGNLLLLAAPAFSDLTIEALVPGARVTAIHRHAVLRGEPGTLCSLLAVGGPAGGVTTEGLRYPLRDDELRPGSTRGVSNELLDRVATVTVRHGSVLAVQPDPGET
jgi:thiamine pyrophosphokinase